MKIPKCSGCMVDRILPNPRSSGIVRDGDNMYCIRCQKKTKVVWVYVPHPTPTQENKCEHGEAKLGCLSTCKHPNSQERGVCHCQCANTNQPSEGWMKEMTQILIEGINPGFEFVDALSVEPLAKRLKSFISTLLTTARREEREELREKVEKCTWDIAPTREGQREQVEALKDAADILLPHFKKAILSLLTQKKGT